EAREARRCPRPEVDEAHRVRPEHSHVALPRDAFQLLLERYPLAADLGESARAHDPVDNAPVRELRQSCAHAMRGDANDGEVGRLWKCVNRWVTRVTVDRLVAGMHAGDTARESQRAEVAKPHVGKALTPLAGTDDDHRGGVEERPQIEDVSGTGPGEAGHVPSSEHRRWSTRSHPDTRSATPSDTDRRSFIRPTIWPTEIPITSASSPFCAIRATTSRTSRPCSGGGSGAAASGAAHASIHGLRRCRTILPECARVITASSDPA